MFHRSVRTGLVTRLPGMRNTHNRSTDGRSVHLCPETNTITVIGPLRPGTLLMAQAMCASSDVLAIVSILDRPENYVLGYIGKDDAISFMTRQEQMAVDRGWVVQLTIYDGPEPVVSGTFDGRQARTDAN